MPQKNDHIETLIWERFDYPDGTTAWQKECENCDKGLLLAPVRFCPVCQGTGYIVLWQKDNPE